MIRLLIVSDFRAIWIAANFLKSSILAGNVIYCRYFLVRARDGFGEISAAFIRVVGSRYFAIGIRLRIYISMVLDVVFYRRRFAVLRDCVCVVSVRPCLMSTVFIRFWIILLLDNSPIRLVLVVSTEGKISFVKVLLPAIFPIKGVG